MPHGGLMLHFILLMKNWQWCAVLGIDVCVCLLQYYRYKSCVVARWRRRRPSTASSSCHCPPPSSHKSNPTCWLTRHKRCACTALHISELTSTIGAARSCGPVIHPPTAESRAISASIYFGVWRAHRWHHAAGGGGAAAHCVLILLWLWHWWRQQAPVSELQHSDNCSIAACVCVFNCSCLSTFTVGVSRVYTAEMYRRRIPLVGCALRGQLRYGQFIDDVTKSCYDMWSSCTCTMYYLTPLDSKLLWLFPCERNVCKLVLISLA